MQNWYALHTKPNCEYRVVAAIEQRGITTFLPEILAPTRRHKQRMRPFFPCYLFTWIDLDQVGVSLLQWTPGLRRLVAFDGCPVPLPDAVIDLIERKLDDLNVAGGWPTAAFQRGDRVRIAAGPLQGMLAIFEGPSKPSERVWVLLNFLNHAKRVQLCAADLEKIRTETDAQTPSRRRRTRGRGRYIKY